ncbi:MAG TPA: preprotein translocase subunit SecG [Allosphingosinicella sp.]|nr:preprotein translocase subunit SecG [Allosphingosinicella sp.]
MFTFLLILQSLVAASMVAVILMQRSEGGGLGVGGSPSGLMSARGAADFLTRATAVLATLFVVLSIALAGLASIERAPMKIDPSLSKVPPRNAPIAPSTDPLAIPPAVPVTKAPAAAGNGSVPAGQ